MEALTMRDLALRAGDVVEVRTAAEILATLDDRGELDALPFMPEMVACCGRRFTVAARAQRVCDTINGGNGIRGMTDTVFLEGVRCDGSGHDGCAAACLVYWKEAWLRKIVDGQAAPSPVGPDREADLLAVTRRNVRTIGDATDVRYRCQATQAIAASVPLSAKDPRSCVHEYTSGNVSFLHFLRVMARAVTMESAKRLRLLAATPVRGTTASSVRTATLDLQPGERVRVKRREEIEATLNDKGKNRGLWFDREMLPFCGQVFRVHHRVPRLIDERSGEMIELSSDCVTLDGAVCSGEHSLGRWFCPRAIFPYWREGWLERVDAVVDLPAARHNGRARRSPAEVPITSA